MIAFSTGMVVRQWWIVGLWKKLMIRWERALNPDVLDKEQRETWLMDRVNKLLP